jgi:hypothetical protein
MKDIGGLPFYGRCYVSVYNNSPTEVIQEDFSIVGVNPYTQEIVMESSEWKSFEDVIESVVSKEKDGGDNILYHVFFSGVLYEDVVTELVDGEVCTGTRDSIEVKECVTYCLTSDWKDIDEQ